jgi:hypothetical protein
MPRIASFCVVIALLLAPKARSDETLAGRACRSVHLQYPGPEAVAFYNEVTVAESAPGTYFCACGFSKGYFGIQELANGKKLVIFSVWDPGRQDDPKSVAEERRVKLLHQGKGVRIGRFGGEGTGGQSFYDFDWEIGQPCRFLIKATPEGKERTAYAAYFYVPRDKAWHHLATFSTITGGTLLKGYYSFVEDFKRDGVSLTKARKASYGNGWVRTLNADWAPLDRATFTADSNPAMNIDAGLAAGRFFLATGGDTKYVTTKLRGAMKREAAGAAPADLPD